jgi:hypothetical protein
MKKRERTPSTGKVRRDYAGGKRGDGHRRRRRVRRPDPKGIRAGKPDPSVTGVSGLVGFGVYLRQIGLDKELQTRFERLKNGPGVIYPMGAQLRLLTDAFAVGETRVFGIEGLAADPLFTYLAGGVVPSVDTLYDDVARFDNAALVSLEELMASHGLARVSNLAGPFVHLDVDTSVVPIFGDDVEGAVPGPNPRYRGRPSYHPMLARVAELDTIVGAELRHGDTGFGADDTLMLRGWVRRLKAKLRRGTSLCVRIDAAGDCAEVLRTLQEEEAFYVIKARITPDLYGAVTLAANWKTIDVDADNEPIREITELTFARDAWRDKAVNVRVGNELRKARPFDRAAESVILGRA